MFSEKELKILRENKNVKKVKENIVIFSDEFKKEFVKRYNNGEVSKEIFRDNGIDPEILGKDRVQDLRKRWNRKYKEEGLKGLIDKRGTTKNKVKKTLEEENEELRLDNLLLKEEIKMIKKLKKQKGGMVD